MRLSYRARPPSTACTIVAKLSSVRIITAASFETSVPVMPIATPMSAFFSAGASFTPSPVIATMLPLRLRMSTRWTLSSGATRAMTPISSIRASASSSLHGANSAPVIARPSMPELAGDRLGGDRVVAGDHPHLDAGRLCAVAIASRGLGARRIDDPDQRQQVRSCDQRQQVGVRGRTWPGRSRAARSP